MSRNARFSDMGFNGLDDDRIQQQLVNQRLPSRGFKGLNPQMQAGVEFLNRPVCLASKKPAHAWPDNAIKQTDGPEKGQQRNEPKRQCDRVKQRTNLQAAKLAH